MDEHKEATNMWPELLGPEGLGSALYHLVVPAQKLLVRFNGLRRDEPGDSYSPAGRPCGVLGTACAIWREVPDSEPKEALALALRVRRDQTAGTVVSIHKVVGQWRVVGIVDVGSYEKLDRILTGGLPIAHRLEVEKVLPVREYEGFAEDVRRRWQATA